jgi:hypothetical protein
VFFVVSSLGGAPAVDGVSFLRRQMTGLWVPEVSFPPSGGRAGMGTARVARTLLAI